jgi:hypothetical protein
MNKESINTYLLIMEEIKRRIVVVNHFLADGNAVYKATQLETIYLQLRKIVELISYSTLVTNKDVYNEQYKNYMTVWRPNNIFKGIEVIHPNFYPIPIKQNPPTKQGVFHDLDEIESGFLTKEDLLMLLDKCGDIMHADNPFGTRIDYSTFEEDARRYTDKIVKLLGVHKVMFFESEHLYLVQMCENDKKPTMTEFVKMLDY